MLINFMEKIVVISCTNRPNSKTLQVSRVYENILKKKGIEVQFLDFRNLPKTLFFEEIFGTKSESYQTLINEFVTANRKFIFVLPEYNGSFPGILKTFLDSIAPRNWADKKVCLVGVSDGRAGNLRGMEHLVGVLQYLKMHVFYNKLPISLINKVMNEEGNFVSEDQQKVCEMQVEGFLNWK